MAHGGKRKGAGQAKGSIHPHISQYWSEAQIKKFFQSMYERQKTSDRIAVWCGDQLSGKAVQPLSNPDGSNLTITFDSSFSPKENS